MPFSVLLIVPHWTPFAQALARHLVPSAGDGGKLFVLCPYSAGGVPHVLFEHMERGTVRIEFGSHANGRLVTGLVQQQQIRTVFLLLPAADVDDEPKKSNPAGIATRTRSLVRPLCALLECLRQCDVAPTLCTVADRSERNNKFLCNTPEGQTEQPRAVVQCADEASARFSSVHALLHAYAVSYRLNAQIVLLEAKLDTAQKREKAVNFVVEKAAKQSDGKAPIHPFKMSEQNDGGGIEECVPLSFVPFARVLLFGTLSAIRDANSRLGTLVPGGEVTVAKCRPGLDTDEAVEEEIVAFGASHLVFIHGADEATREAWEAGGPTNLRDNVRNNLFSPWLLSNIGDRFGIVFLEIDQQHEAGAKSNGKIVPIIDGTQIMSRYAVVKHFGDKICQLKVHSPQ